jgi:hypothetical protein
VLKKFFLPIIRIVNDPGTGVPELRGRRPALAAAQGRADLAHRENVIGLAVERDRSCAFILSRFCSTSKLVGCSL